MGQLVEGVWGCCEVRWSCRGATQASTLWKPCAVLGAADKHAAGVWLGCCTPHPPASEAMSVGMCLCLAAVQAPEGADQLVRTALKCCLAADKGTKFGPVLGSFLADTLSPLPASTPLLQVGGGSAEPCSSQSW